MTNETAVERLGEALFVLSACIRDSLADDRTHAAYEKVVSAFQALSPTAPAPDAVRDTLYIHFADNGNIRKWSREPFEGGVAYVAVDARDGE